MPERTYFATRSGSAFSAAAFEKIDDYYQFLTSSRRLELYKRILKYSYQGYTRAGLISGGDQDEFTMMHANHFSNIVSHMMSMTITQRPAFEPRATNTDYKSKAQCIVARGVLDYYNRDKGMGQAGENATEDCLLFGEGETVVQWDAFAGADYMANPNAPGQTIKDGDVVFKNFNVLNAVRDPNLTGAEKMTWRIYRDFINRYDLSARFPEAVSRINSLEVDASLMSQRWLSPWTGKMDDQVPVYILYHDKTPSVPAGRFALLIDKNMPLMDGGLPYDFFPGFRMAAREHKLTPFGYSVSFDLLPIQEAIDILYSAVITNQSNFGVQNILLPNGSNISVEQLIDGLNAIFYDPKQGEPKPLNLTNTPAEIFQMIDRLEKIMEVLSGVNAVTRGDPQANLKSGAALALVQSMAIQFNSGLQKAYNKQIEDIGTGLVKVLGKFPKTKRIVEIAGKANRKYMKEFTAEDLSSINRVTVDLGNPLARTTAGKVQIAEDLLSNKLIDTPEQYLQVLTTGQLEPLIEGKQAELMLISSENEMMAEAKAPIVAVTDSHALHVQEHKCVLASPEARINPQVVAVVTGHLNEHIKMLEQLSVSNPNLLIALGQTPMQPAMPQPPAAGGRGGAPGVVDPTALPVKDASKVNLPSMPKNALTGEQAPAPLPPAAA